MNSHKPWVVVTGCSTGIGLACTKKFLAEGYELIGCLRDAQRGAELEETFGSKFHPVYMEITDADSRKEAAAQIHNLLKKHNALLGCLINNAGIAVGAPLKYIDIEELKYQFEVNLFGLIGFTQALIPMLETGKAKRKRKIFNMSSVSGRISNPFLGPYAGSKFALEAISDALRMELSIHDIEVILIEPGPISTPIWDKSIDSQDKYLDTEYAPYIHSVNRMISKLKKIAIPPERVADTIFRAWEKRKASTRYIVARQRWVLSLFLKFAPDSLKDYLNKRQLRLIQKRSNQV